MSLFGLLRRRGWILKQFLAVYNLAIAFSEFSKYCILFHSPGVRGMQTFSNSQWAANLAKMRKTWLELKVEWGAKLFK